MQTSFIKHDDDPMTDYQPGALKRHVVDLLEVTARDLDNDRVCVLKKINAKAKKHKVAAKKARRRANKQLEKVYCSK